MFEGRLFEDGTGGGFVFAGGSRFRRTANC